MSTRPPPVPPESRSKKGTGEGPDPRLKEAAKGGRPDDPDQQGQSANTKVNTTHQGLQQDR
jgi:hypothetical protein